MTIDIQSASENGPIAAKLHVHLAQAVRCQKPQIAGDPACPRTV